MTIFLPCIPVADLQYQLVLAQLKLVLTRYPEAVTLQLHHRWVVDLTMSTEEVHVYDREEVVRLIFQLMMMPQYC